MKNALFLSWSSLASRPLSSTLSAIAVAGGIALLCALFLLGQGIDSGLTRNARNIDIVVGAKGSPLQLVLSSVYQADLPTGNIEMDEAQKIIRHPQVKKSVPIAIGDNYKGWRVVGTTPDYLGLYGATVKEGRIFSHPFEVVAGSQTGLKIGDKFAAAHGFAADSDDIHDAYLYQVVGILAPSGTVVDKLLLTPFESVQTLHAHHEEHEDHEGHHESAEEEAAEEALAHQVTALLIQVRSPMAVMNLPRQINQGSDLLAASPAYEMTRFSQNMGIGRTFILILAAGIVALSLLMLFSTLAAGLASRQYDLAVLRVLGASPSTVFATIVFEGIFIGAAGAILGLIAGHALAFTAVSAIETLQSLIVPYDLLIPSGIDVCLIGLGVLSGALAALLPARSAARLDIAALLARGTI